MMKASLPELHSLKTYLVHAITKNKGHLVTVNAQVGLMTNKTVTLPAYTDRPLLAFARGSPLPEAVGYAPRSFAHGLQPHVMAPAYQHARQAGIKSCIEVSAPGDANKVGNVTMGDTLLTEAAR